MKIAANTASTKAMMGLKLKAMNIALIFSFFQPCPYLHMKYGNIEVVGGYKCKRKISHKKTVP